MPMQRSMFATPAEVDSCTMQLTFDRAEGPEFIALLVTGHSKKRSSPLWSASYEMWEFGLIEQGKVFAVFAEVIAEYRPTDQTSLRLLVNKKLHALQLPLL